MKNRKDVKVAMEQSLFDEFTEPYGFGDDLAPLIREAIQKKVTRNPQLDDVPEPDDRKAKTVTVPMEQALYDEVASYLGFGDSFSRWVRQALREEIERREAGGNGRPMATATN